MTLTDAQIEINQNPEYWEWFERWWDEDFSWAGLANKKTPEGTHLHVHYLRHSDKLIMRFNREWHPVNAPYHDKDGNIEKDSNLQLSLASETLRYLKEQIYTGVVKPQNTFSNQQLFNHDWVVSSSFSFSNSKIGSLSNSFLDTPTFSARNFNKSIIAVEIPVSSNTKDEFKFTNCTFIMKSELSGKHDSKISLQNCIFKSSLSLLFNILNIENIESPSIVIKPVFSTLSSNTVSNFNLKLIMNKTNVSNIVIQNTLRTDRKVNHAIADISFGAKQKLSIANISFDDFKLSHKNMGTVKLSNCSFSKKVRLLETQIKKLEVLDSTFKKGISAHGVILSEKTEIKGVKVYQVCDFSGAKFNSGATWNPIDQGSNEGAISIIENGNFNHAVFKDAVKSRKSSAVNFNDTEFVGSANFDDVTFDGIPKFHGAELHAETSFRNMKNIPDLGNNSKVTDKQIYDHYNAAFRTLRQHMEKNNNSPTAFFFGRLEMIAKEKRGETKDVPKAEIRFTKWYGKFADYGQNFAIPLKYLGIAYGLSLICQFVVFTTTASKCLLWQNGCKIDGVLVGEAFERGTTFLLPPFTMLTNRSIDGEAKPSLNWFTDILSGAGMLVHAVSASLLLFLFALSVKRKMQIK